MDITPKKQDSKFSINERYDFLFATALSKPVRWLLVLPVAFCAMGAIQFLGSALIKLLCNLFGDGEAVAVLLNSILCTIKYMLFIIAAVATTPVVKKRKVMMALLALVVGLLILGASNALLVAVAREFDMTMLIATTVCCVLGMIIGVISVYVKTREGSVTSIQQKHNVGE